MKFVVETLGRGRVPARLGPGLRRRPRAVPSRPAPVEVLDDADRVADPRPPVPPGGWSSGVRAPADAGPGAVTIDVPLGDTVRSELELSPTWPTATATASSLSRDQNVVSATWRSPTSRHPRRRSRTVASSPAARPTRPTSGPAPARGVRPRHHRRARRRPGAVDEPGAAPELVAAGPRVGVPELLRPAPDRRHRPRRFQGPRRRAHRDGYHVYVGADLDAARWARWSGGSPSRDVPAAVDALVGMWEALRHPGETLGRSARRVGLDALAARLGTLHDRWAPGPEPDPDPMAGGRPEPPAPIDLDRSAPHRPSDHLVPPHPPPSRRPPCPSPSPSPRRTGPGRRRQGRRGAQPAPLPARSRRWPAPTSASPWCCSSASAARSSPPARRGEAGAGRRVRRRPHAGRLRRRRAVHRERHVHAAGPAVRRGSARELAAVWALAGRQPGRLRRLRRARCTAAASRWNRGRTGLVDEIVAGKAALERPAAVWRSVLCNMLVCLALWMAARTRATGPSSPCCGGHCWPSSRPVRALDRQHDHLRPRRLRGHGHLGRDVPQPGLDRARQHRRRRPAHRPGLRRAGPTGGHERRVALDALDAPGSEGGLPIDPLASVAPVTAAAAAPELQAS